MMEKSPPALHKTFITTSRFYLLFNLEVHLHSGQLRSGPLHIRGRSGHVQMGPQIPDLYNGN